MSSNDVSTLVGSAVICLVAFGLIALLAVGFFKRANKQKQGTTNTEAPQSEQKNIAPVSNKSIRQYSFENEASEIKTLEVKLVSSNSYVISLDGNIVIIFGWETGTVKFKGEQLPEGVRFSLPDGSSLELINPSPYSLDHLQILRNGKPLNGSAPVKEIKNVGKKEKVRIPQFIYNPNITPEQVQQALSTPKDDEPNQKGGSLPKQSSLIEVVKEFYKDLLETFSFRFIPKKAYQLLASSSKDKPSGSFGMRIAIFAPGRAAGERVDECKPLNHLKHDGAAGFVGDEPHVCHPIQMGWGSGSNLGPPLPTRR